MTMVTVTRIGDLRVSPAGWSNSDFEWNVMLAAFRLRGKLEAGSFSYDRLIEGIADSAVPLIGDLRDRGFYSWLILLGPILNMERKSRISNYSLSSPLRKKNIDYKSSIERTYRYEYSERVAGLYQIHWDCFRKYIEFLTNNSWAIGFLSQKRDVELLENFDTFYQAASFRDHRVPSMDISWPHLSESICPSGEIVVKTFGAYDDREREVDFIFSPDILKEICCQPREVVLNNP